MKHWENFDWGSSNDWYKECIGKEIFEQKIYERFFSVEENDIVVDIGASIGIFTYSILDKNPSHVFCFEPSLEQFPTLIKNTLNGFVTCISKGISDIDGVKVLNDVYGYNNQPLEVHTLRFDTFIKKYNIEKDSINIFYQSNIRSKNDTSNKLREEIVCKLGKRVLVLVRFNYNLSFTVASGKESGCWFVVL